MGKIKYVEVKLTSKMGHETLKLKLSEAVGELQNIAAQDAKFVFVDGRFTPSADLNEDMLANATDVSVTNRLKGGAL